MDELIPKIATGLPPGVKEKGQRVDFRTEQFDLAIQTKGYRVWWSRAAVCPCRNNPETDQPLITCQLCKGRGRFWFLPEIGLEAAETDEHGNPVVVNDAEDAVLIQAIMTSATLDTQVYEKFGEWFFGAVKVTVQPGNKLGYLDRFVMADSIMAWSQLIEFDGGATIDVVGGYSRKGIRYPAVRVNLLRSLTKVYKQDRDYAINSEGGLDWRIDPPAAQNLTIQYFVHPVFEMVDHVYVHRDTLVKMKQLTTDKAGQVRYLPVHSMAKLDYLMDQTVMTER